MTVSLWVSILAAIVAGIFGGIVGPLINDWLTHSRWRRQRSFELKYEAFRGAVDALAAWEADALDANLQNAKTEHQGSTRKVEVQPSTAQALEHYKSLLQGNWGQTTFFRQTPSIGKKIVVFPRFSSSVLAWGNSGDSLLNSSHRDWYTAE